MENLKKQFKVVLIEDDADHAEITEFYIKEASENVSIVHLNNGIEAMRHITEIETDTDRMPHLILLDLQLPMFDGHEILQKIKKNPSLRQIPVVVFTTSNAQTDITRALENHANSYILKPIEEDRFKEIIKPIINYWQLNERIYERKEFKNDQEKY